VACDPLVDALKDRGLNVLRLPRADFGPLMLLRSDGRRKLRTVGPLGGELVSNSACPLPAVRTDEPVMDLEVTRTRKLGGSLAAELLGGIFKALDLSPELSLEYERGTSATIELLDVHRDSCLEGDVAAYLEKGVHPRTSYVAGIAEADELYLVTGVLKSGAFATKVSSTVAAGVSAKVPVGGAVTVSVSANGETGEESVVSFKNSRRLVIAFEAIRLWFEDGRFTTLASAVGHSAYAVPPALVAAPRRLVLRDDLVAEAASW
jgi:hypothetical protein